MFKYLMKKLLNLYFSRTEILFGPFKSRGVIVNYAPIITSTRSPVVQTPNELERIQMCSLGSRHPPV